MRRVRVRLHGGLERYADMRREHDVRLEDGAALSSVQDALAIPRGEVGLFAVNGCLFPEGRVADDGDVVDIYPSFGGG